MEVWIARDMCGELAQFEDCPYKYEISEGEYMWISEKGGEDINPNLYPNITFENSPKLVTL